MKPSAPPDRVPPTPDAAPVAYCTNVHPGVTLNEVRANLARYAAAVRDRVCPGRVLPVGLWLGADAAAAAARDPAAVADLSRFLTDHGLAVASLNAFPFGPFHGRPVKDAVYLPHWADPARLTYTRDAARVLAGLLPEAAEGGVSTLPLGWPPHVDDPATFRSEAAARLTDLVHHLARLELDTGRLVHVDLEPEPGCLLQSAADVVGFFDRHLLGTPDELSVRAYLRVCHDVCHSAVMFEPQSEALAAYRDAGLTLGRVQISSAPALDFDTLDDDRWAPAAAALAAFAEPHYRHQTCVRDAGGAVRRYPDLPDALAAERTRDPAGRLRGEWRVHFHVPLHRTRVGPDRLLHTTRPDVTALFQALQDHPDRPRLETETYTWGVLPGDRVDDDALIAGLAEELTWAKDAAAVRLT